MEMMSSVMVIPEPVMFFSLSISGISLLVVFAVVCGYVFYDALWALSVKRRIAHITFRRTNTLMPCCAHHISDWTGRTHAKGQTTENVEARYLVGRRTADKIEQRAQNTRHELRESNSSR